MTTSRYYRSQEPPPGRRPLKLVALFFVVLFLLVGILAGVLVLSPDIALTVPGKAGVALHDFATGVRLKIEAVLSDQGVLGGLRRWAEPFLSGLGLNLETILIGLVLLAFAIICIRILVVTSRPAESVEEAELRLGQAGSRDGGRPGPYWPYDRRPGPGSVVRARQPAPPDLPLEEAAGMPPRPPASGGLDAGEAAALPASATGDAWPILRHSAPRPRADAAVGGPVLASGQAADARPVPGAGPAAFTVPEPIGSPRMSPGRPRTPSGLGDAAAPFRLPGPAPAFEMQSEAGANAPVQPLPQPGAAGSSATAASVPPPLPEFAPSGPRAVTPGSGEYGAPQAGGYPAPPQPGVYGEAPPLAANTPGLELPEANGYLADMPAPAYARPAARELPEPPFEPAFLPGPGRGPAAQPRARDVWVESRPGLGTGLRKFALPGLLLLLGGAAAAYGLQIPSLAKFITGGPYGDYLLISAAGLVCLLVATVFVNGPMKSTPRRVPGAALAGAAGEMAAAAEPATLRGREPRFGGPGEGRPARAVAPAPIPAREALAGGLEAPDAIDWGKLPKPSIFLPGTQAATTVGVDIGTAWIKVVQLGATRQGLQVFNMALVPTPEGIMAEGDIADPDALGDVIKDLFASRNIVQRQVTVALGGQGVIIRHVQFPVMSPDELREVLRWEAEHHIPIPPAEAVVDFTVMPGQASEDERGNRQMRVMLVGAQKRVVEAQVQALRRAKLVAKGVDAEPLACYRAVEAAGHYEEDPLRYAQAVIDLGHSSTKLGIYLRGALEMSRTLGVGGRTFTTVLAERLKVPEAEAETLKRQYGVHPEGGRILQALTPTLQDLMFEVRRSFEFFASRHFGQSVRQVCLVGGGARMPGIANALARYLNPYLGERVPEGAETRVEVVDPLTAVSLSPRYNRHAGLIGPEFVMALGLALTEEEVTAHEG